MCAFIKKYRRACLHALCIYPKKPNIWCRLLKKYSHVFTKIDFFHKAKSICITMDAGVHQDRLKQWLDIQKVPQYYESFKDYGIDTIEDIALINDENAKILKIKPFHLVKMRRNPSEYIVDYPSYKDQLQSVLLETKKCVTCLRILEKLYFNPRQWGMKDFGECGTCIEVRRTMLLIDSAERRKETERLEAKKVQQERAEAERLQTLVVRQKENDAKKNAKLEPKTLTTPPKSPAKKSPKKKKESPPSSLCRLWKTKGHCSFKNTVRGCKYSHEPEWCGRAS